MIPQVWSTETNHVQSEGQERFAGCGDEIAEGVGWNAWNADRIFLIDTAFQKV